MNTFPNHKSFAMTNAKKPLVLVLLLAGAVHCHPASAVTFPTGASLSITSGVLTNTGSGSLVTGGSYFGMDMNGNGNIAPSEKTAITSKGTIPIGSAITATGSHTGPINNTERPAFDIWTFFGNTGMDYLSVAATDNGNGTLGLSGWTVTWNGIAAIPMNARAWQPGNCSSLGCTGWTFTDGTARFQVTPTPATGDAWNTINGSAYTLDYTATVPNGDPSGFGNVKYYLHLVGTVTLPAFTLANDSAVAKTAILKNINVTANDTQTNYVIDSSNAVTIVTAPTHGTATAKTDNTVDYTSAGGYTGSDSFTYKVSSNGITSSTATVTVTVSAALPPTANADTATTSGTTPATISVLTNDTAGDSAISASTVAISTAAGHGTATANPSGTITYTAASGFSGVDTFKYTVNDTGGNTSNAATVSVTVRATNPASSSGTLSPGTTATAAGSTTGGGLTSTNTGADSALSQQCVGGCFDIRVAGLSAGGTINVVLPLSAAIPTGAVYRKLVSGTWKDFSTANGNAIASAAALSTGPVVCPEVGSSSYSSGLTAGNQCIQLSIVDGGANDDDGLANGTVLDPGGVGVRAVFVDTRAGSTGGCSLSSGQTNLSDRGEWWLMLGFVAWLGMVFWRRQSRA